MPVHVSAAWREEHPPRPARASEASERALFLPMELRHTMRGF